MERRRVVLVAAVVLAVGWGTFLAGPFVNGHDVRWTGGMSWHVQCQTVVFPVRGEPSCIAEVGALGVATGLAGLAASAAAFVALQTGSPRALLVAHRHAVAAGVLLVAGLAVGAARNFTFAEIPFDVAAVGFAVGPVVVLARARREGFVLVTPRAAGASPVPP